ncbi:D-alanine--D-alanine ligase family protein [Facklamia miroungae]|uniref:D-alanine--D-alanine ligase n=1 Tax=Facklamia miroungae TaxID=120956 RepID=A0A1G7QDG7_9LACT|nr:D-alanine--D-alanine ligase [Facklamia miroungae]NKZ28909.1 D-alanine--D-alanine ligase [Facklamia miroungae]SDF96597.1 D-alanine-D-alanine ligase [Facklamia miroungae]
MDIVVLAGGLSDERDVSLSSGSQISNALIKNGHRVLLLDLYIGMKDVREFEEAYRLYGKSKYTYRVPKKAPDLQKMIRENQNRTNQIGMNVISICQSADIVFLGLHGGIGENGVLQALFDLYQIKYTGSDYKGSLLAMDKIVSKEIMVANNIPTPEWWVIEDYDEVNMEAPAVVKPNDNGSSIGVEIVDEQSQLMASINQAKKYSDKILVEKKIIGREFSVGILGNQALPVIELIPKEGFYDYSNKYQAGATEEITPANLQPNLSKKMQQIALKIFRKLDLKVYGRVDFLMNSENDIYCIEVNSLPGMTPTSLLPQEALAKGICYEELCQQIVELSLEKY